MILLSKYQKQVAGLLWFNTLHICDPNRKRIIWFSRIIEAATSSIIYANFGLCIEKERKKHYTTSSRNRRSHWKLVAWKPIDVHVMFIPIVEHNHNTCRLINEWSFFTFKRPIPWPRPVRFKLIKFLYIKN